MKVFLIKKMRKPFVGGNWKMNGTKKEIEKILFLLDKEKNNKVQVVVALPSLYLGLEKEKTKVDLCVQNIYQEEKGAFTGEISSEMAKDFDIDWVLIGHSERRALFGETNDFVNKKIKKAQEKGLSVIVCIGETLKEKERKETFLIIEKQLTECFSGIQEESWKDVVIAYEPVWAIGTGNSATPEDAQTVHFFIREWLNKNISPKVSSETRIVYGGSVKKTNCKDLINQTDVDGFLVGGASMTTEFIEIVKSTYQ